MMDIINMESFYDITSGDFKDIWDSDLDPTDTLKLSSDSDMPDWLLERDVKLPTVILHDKLMSDAMLGTRPIKTEHSYSLNSDGDSMPDSPRSLRNKMDDMEEECYPAIPMNSATTRRLVDVTQIQKLPPHNLQNATTITTCQIINTSHNNSINSGTSTINTIPMQATLNPLNLHLRTPVNNTTTIKPILLQTHQQMTSIDNISFNRHTKTTIISPDEIDIDDIKDEPMSAEDEIDSSCPASPNSSTYGLSLANMAAITNTDLVFEHKNGSLHLSPASQHLLKPHFVGLVNSQTVPATATSPQKIILPKLRVESHTQQQGFGLPPTPPSSLASDESEGNQSPEHHLISPMSPPMQQQQISSSTSSSTSSSPASSPSNSPSNRRSNLNLNTTGSNNLSGSTSGSTGRGYSGSSTRQPIHTPLISSQPKGSTGNLILTEEEKRTLLAEGYPIPTRLPLTKAEEKSLKKIRRKIKNKISAQESRRKKKEYMDQLERRVEILVTENTEYRKRVENLEDSNANLLNQLAKLQALVNKQQQKK